jgi:hypothetical protein
MCNCNVNAGALYGNRHQHNNNENGRVWLLQNRSQIGRCARTCLFGIAAAYGASCSTADMFETAKTKPEKFVLVPKTARGEFGVVITSA